jgi:lipopolysaccharide/colanic/teichoic acid biosynthesis glycosyltransferase
MFLNGEPVCQDSVFRQDFAHALFGRVKPPVRVWYDPIKVCVDLTLAVILSVLSMPVFLLACLAVKLTSRGPVIYCQTRLGRGGRPYTIYKIRTMTHNCEQSSGICWAKPNDCRVTPIGFVLRRLHIDELPQLWNVLLCQMSLVGPRPERPEFLPDLLKAIPRYRERLFVRPGITGLAQVQLPADTNLDSVRRKLAYDVYYVENLSFWLDCRILLATVLHICRVPVSLRRIVFAIPHGEPVERTLADAPQQTSPMPEFTAV